MRKHQRVTGRAASVPGGMAAGGVTSLMSTVTLAAVLAKLVSVGILDQEKIGYGIMVLLMTASFLGATVAQWRIQRRRSLMCMISGGIYFLMLLSITALFFGGQYTGIGATALMVLAGTGIAALRAGRAAEKGMRNGRRRNVRIAKQYTGK